MADRELSVKKNKNPTMEMLKNNKFGKIKFTHFIGNLVIQTSVKHHKGCVNL